ncbi:hypothetical protein LMG31884_10980 [Xanthomonas hydrangeae]|uniref:hypothetical protein n=1 Tax=Xanthomonas hydrangeae TaxID=2775159 RepID=UPI0019661C5B|nr:hypothetical protein LMG31884_10980 [Xanthomonas hydrangeae]CAD7714393.1 hypothetical protein LMG31884_10980 [Xanthomonas hydrangeae]CAD7723588.1 hypothetical protein LMG31887_10980 [Xanthomonas hydrangeae]CAD7723592.1 hypothetical protein LMG31887_10980 [Xanthomonas hydrangeae]
MDAGSGKNMDIQQFVELCDRVKTRSASLPELSNEEAYQALSEAAAGFEKKLLSTVIALRKYLAIRCERGNAKRDPYLSILAVIRDATRAEHPNAKNPALNWEQLVEIVLSAQGSLHWFRPGQAEKFSDEENALSQACLKLSRLGVEISEENCEVRISQHSHVLIEAEISRLANAVGGEGILEKVFSSLEPQYHQPFGRYLFGRKVSTGIARIIPAVPWGYLIALGVKHLPAQKAANGEHDFEQLVHLIRDLITVFEIQPYSIWSNLLFGPDRLMSLLQETVLYDNLIAVQQISGRHAKLILSSLTKPFVNAGHVSYRVRLKDATKIALAAIELSHTKRQTSVTADDLAKASGLRKDIVETALIDVLAFGEGVSNRTLSFPPSSEEIDSSFKPLFKRGKRYRLLPRSLTAMGAMNAVLNMISRPNDVFDNALDKKLGEILEDFIRTQIHDAGVPVHTGDIQSDGRELLGECDALIDTPRGIFIFEVKKKGLTRKAMAGRDADLLVDLSQSLMKAHEQAYKAEAHLVKHGEITLKDKQGKEVTVALDGRDIEKASISLTDFGGLQSRSILQRILDTAIRIEVNADNERDNKRLKDWRETIAALRGYVIEEKPDRPFSNSTFLSVPQILTLLERVEDADGFFNEVTRGRYLVYGLQDFYSEYDQALKLADLTTAQSPA